MGSYLDKPVILDFFGLPGSGKTTIAHVLAENLRNKGYKVQEEIYIVNNEYSSFRRMAVKMWNAACFTAGNLGFMLSLFRSLGKNAFTSISEKLKQWINICFVLASLNKSNDADYIIADQGIVQAAVSLCFNCKETEAAAKLSMLVSKVKMPIRYINIDADVDTVLYRMETRKTNYSRIEKLDDPNEKKTGLQKIKLICEYIRKGIAHVQLKNNEKTDVSNLAIELIEQL